ncbi:hypothetical protein QYM36_003078, partial [Artemia franciscana]
MAGNFNCNPAKENIHTDIFLNCLPASVQIWPESLDLTYTHSSGHTSNTDHIQSCRSIPCIPITVHTDDPIKDHLGLSFHLQPSQNIDFQKTRRRVQKKNWKCGADLYMATVCSILSCIKVQFYLLYSSPPETSTMIDLNTYYYQIVHAMEESESTAGWYEGYYRNDFPIEHREERGDMNEVIPVSAKQLYNAIFCVLSSEPDEVLQNKPYRSSKDDKNAGLCVNRTEEWVSPMGQTSKKQDSLLSDSESNSKSKTEGQVTSCFDIGEFNVLWRHSGPYSAIHYAKEFITDTTYIGSKIVNAILYRILR